MAMVQASFNPTACYEALSRGGSAFYSGDEPGAVNGILDRLARSVRPGELEAESDESRRSRRPPG